LGLYAHYLGFKVLGKIRDSTGGVKNFLKKRVYKSFYLKEVILNGF